MNKHQSEGAERPNRLLPARIGTRLFLLIALILLPLSLLLAWTHYERYRLRKAYALETELEVAHGVAGTFAAYVDGIRRQNRAVGEAILTFGSPTEEKVVRVLAAAMSEYPAVRNMSWADPRGTVLVSTFPDLVGRDLSRRHYVQQIFGGEPWSLGDLTPSGAAVQRPTFAVATAVRAEDGRLLGIVVAGIEPSEIGRIILEHDRPAEGNYALFDSRGVLVYRSRHPHLDWEERLKWRRADPLLRKALETKDDQVGITHLDPDDGEWMSARVPIEGLDWIAGAGRPTSVALGPVKEGYLKDAAFALVITSLAFFLAYRLARTIAGPLQRLEQEALKIGPEGIPPREDSQAPKEVRHLGPPWPRWPTTSCSRQRHCTKAESGCGRGCVSPISASSSTTIWPISSICLPKCAKSADGNSTS